MDASGFTHVVTYIFVPVRVSTCITNISSCYYQNTPNMYTFISYQLTSTNFDNTILPTTTIFFGCFDGSDLNLMMSSQRPYRENLIDSLDDLWYVKSK